jgi:hypothetical protein
MKSWTQNVGRGEIIGKIIYRNVWMPRQLFYTSIAKVEAPYNNETHALETKCINLKVIYD